MMLESTDELWNYDMESSFVVVVVVVFFGVVDVVKVVRCCRISC